MANNADPDQLASSDQLACTLFAKAGIRTWVNKFSNVHNRLQNRAWRINIMQWGLLFVKLHVVSVRFHLNSPEKGNKYLASFAYEYLFQKTPHRGDSSDIHKICFNLWCNNKSHNF